eukprot:9022853-Karenia_brevis.AAC.1
MSLDSITYVCVHLPPQLFVISSTIFPMLAVLPDTFADFLQHFNARCIFAMQYLSSGEYRALHVWTERVRAVLPSEHFAIQGILETFRILVIKDTVGVCET